MYTVQYGLLYSIVGPWVSILAPFILFETMRTKNTGNYCPHKLLLLGEKQRKKKCATTATSNWRTNQNRGID